MAAVVQIAEKKEGMAESRFALDTPDGFRIYGILNRAAAPAEKLLVIAHGVTGFPGEWLHQSAARYFAARGYDVVRFAFYSGEDNARKLLNCTLQTHAADLGLVLAGKRAGYKKVFVAGHSYGGMTTLLANPDVNAVTMWDSTLWPYKEFWERETRFDEESGLYFFDYGFAVAVSPEMVAEGSAYDFDRVAALAQQMKAPVQMIGASDGIRTDGQKRVFACFPGRKDFALIPGSGHEFTEGETVFALLEKTYDWFERF
jgi:pimeloyl-ACP methyl ester carboxylesterase